MGVTEGLCTCAIGVCGWVMAHMYIGDGTDSTAGVGSELTGWLTV